MGSGKTMLILSVFVPFTSLSSQQTVSLEPEMRVPSWTSEGLIAMRGPLRPWRAVNLSDARLTTTDDDRKVPPTHQGNVRLRSPFLAGTLSFVSGLVVVNGIGSFYAGNSGHGLRHLVIGIGTMGVAAGAAVACYSCDGNEPLVYVALFAFSAYIANYVWSVVTAVADANAFNRSAPGRSVSRIEPTVTVLVGHSPDPFTVSPDGRMGLGISVRF